jgi:drug/metabolite transporter (DMT)-like permease
MTGFAIASPAMFAELAPTTEVRLYIVGSALMVLSAALGAVRKREWKEWILLPAISWAFATNIADRISERGDANDLVSAALIVVFFVVPIPLLLAYFRNRQDELQRSLITNAAGVAFLATLFGSIGYAVLDALGGFDPLPPIAIPIFAVGTWLVAWVALRLRVA